MTQKTFFLGLGGQKCGSTWIQAYLNRQAGSDFGRLGEYQVWEHVLGGVFARYEVAEPPLRQKLRAKLKTGLGGEEPAQHLRWRLQSDPEAYFDYFAALLEQPGIVRTGDITPSYAALPPETLARIRDGFAKRGIETRAIFSMRDPVDRLRSHLRMEMEKGRLPLSQENSAPLRAFYANKEAEARSRYDLTLANIDVVFAPHERHFALFETLFTDAGIAALAGFAGVPAEAGSGSTKVNARASGGQIPEALAAEIAAHYAPSYRAVAARLPEAATLWPSARFVLTSA